MAEQPHGSMACLDAALRDCVLFTRILQALVQGRVRILPPRFISTSHVAAPPCGIAAARGAWTSAQTVPAAWIWTGQIGWS
jgi:hypothetical protein